MSSFRCISWIWWDEERMSFQIHLRPPRENHFLGDKNHYVQLQLITYNNHWKMAKRWRNDSQNILKYFWFDEASRVIRFGGLWCMCMAIFVVIDILMLMVVLQTRITTLLCSALHQSWSIRKVNEFVFDLKWTAWFQVERKSVLFVSFPVLRQQPLVCDSWTLPGPSPVPSAMQTAIRIIDRQWWRLRFGIGGLKGHQTDRLLPLSLLYFILLWCLFDLCLGDVLCHLHHCLNNSSHMVLWPASDGSYSDIIKTLICLSPDTDLFSSKILTVGRGHSPYRGG